jgi:heme oxygenase
MREVTGDELRRSNGEGGSRILVSVLGVVYDASGEKGREFFGAGGPYSAMAGHDATFMLANMSLRPADADRFVQYDQDDLQAIAEWIAYFDTGYERCGWLVDPSLRHTHTLRDLPFVPLKKMGPTAYGGDGDEATQRAKHAAAQDDYDRLLLSSGLSDKRATAASAGVPASTAPFSSTIFHATRHHHNRVMRCELMARCVDGTISHKSYGRFLAQLHYVYGELEAQLEAQLEAPPAGDGVAPSCAGSNQAQLAVCGGSGSSASGGGSNPVAALHDPRLARLPALAEDLAVFWGPSWRDLLPAPLLATIRYVARVSDLAAMAASGDGCGLHRLAVHHWMRYGAGLAGGQFLRTSLTRGLKMQGRGVKYHSFELSDVAAFYASYMRALDGVGDDATDEERSAMVEEAALAFELNIALNDAVMAGVAAL